MSTRIPIPAGEVTMPAELFDLVSEVLFEADRACIKHNGLRRLRDSLRTLHACERRLGLRPERTEEDDA